MDVLSLSEKEVILNPFSAIQLIHGIKLTNDQICDFKKFVLSEKPDSKHISRKQFIAQKPGLMYLKKGYFGLKKD